MNFLTLLKIPLVRSLLLSLTIRVAKELAKRTDTDVDDKIVEELEKATKIFLA